MKKFVKLIVLVLLVLITLRGWTYKGIEYIGIRPLSEANETYLENAFDRSMQTFGVLSALKIGLAIIEGTEVGVGASVQVGDAVQAVYDYVDIAWRVVLASGAILLGTQYLLKSANLIGQGFIVLMFFLFILHEIYFLFFKKQVLFRKIIKDITVFIFLLSFALLFLLPLSVTGGRWLSRQITAPSIEKAESGFAQMQMSLFPENPTEQKGILKTITHVKDKLYQVTRFLTNKSEEIREWMLKMMAGYIFDCLIFPVGLFLFFFWLIRFGARYILNVRREHSFQKDIAVLLAGQKMIKDKN